MQRLLARFQTPLLALAAWALSATPATATWSIVLVNHDTGEVAVATATCIANDDLKVSVPVVWVGAGTGVVQSQVDGTGTNRRIIRDGLRDGLTPAEIRFNVVTQGLTPGRHQFGIAAFSGPATTLTGGQVGFARPGVAGATPDGRITYAIQGNVLTGDEVVYAAERALLAARGDTGQRLLAGMFGARALGGDGRCSCDENMPTSCGAPPASFTKSAHSGFMIVARMGDRNGNCQPVDGCANGDYYMCLNAIGGVGDPDPVFVLGDALLDFRAALAGRPDGVHSSVVAAASALPADGRTETTLSLKLRDLNGDPLTHGGATIEVAPAVANEAPLVTARNVTDHGNGSYTVEVVAGRAPGTQELAVTADDGFEKATLYPFPTVRLDPATRLHAGEDEVSATTGGSVPFTVDLPPAAGRRFLLLASASGTSPGIPVGKATVPLNPDDLFLAILSGEAGVQGSPGFLDGAGRARATWVAPPSLLLPLVGSEISWAAVAFDGVGFVATNVATVQVVP